MEVSSVQNLCKHLIFCAIQRCRMSDELCRISIVLKLCPEFNPPLVRISVSDTGVGCNLKEFEALRYATNPISASKFDGVITITTTGISDNEIHTFSLNINETISSGRLTKLSSISKCGAKFSGTEAVLSTAESLNDLQSDISLFLHKMSMVKLPTVAVELLVDSLGVRGSQLQSCVLAVDCSPLPSSATNIERLKSGLEEYVLKHGNRLENFCQLCFSTAEHLKVGTGMAKRSGTSQSKRQMMEAVVVISETSEPAFPACCRPSGKRTEVFFFKDFTPCSIPQPSLDALTSIKWKDYGLTLKRITDQDDIALLEWENLPPNFHIDIALHSYHKEVMMVPSAGNRQADKTFTRKALKLALYELKETNDKALLSSHALKICNYAPDLAKTIAGLVLSSCDINFKKECFSVLGLQCQKLEASGLENCIKDKILSAIGSNDRKAQRTREPAAILFQNECFQLDFQDEDYEDGEEMFSSLKL
ncbi:type 2 DNA topoisomerase 6 subunit B-like [Coffea arabica]|uniref:Type 2 DNA topoisomerase 6 subunit B-like n=1 Tax=Coffea arabica TaxID=13443 RepID=A0ABM4W9R3_COFAR